MFKFFFKMYFGVMIYLCPMAYFVESMEIDNYRGMFGIVSYYIVVFYITWRVVCNKYNLDSKKRTSSNTVSKAINEDNVDEMDSMTGVEFEMFLLAHFKKSGYSAWQTKGSSDYGADIVLKKSNKKIVIQAKRYSSSIGLKAVQEIVGALSYYRAHKGIVITNNYYTKNAIKLAHSNNIELWDRDELLKRISNNDFSVNVSKGNSIIKNNSKCPYCNSKLVIRRGQYGRFYGCTKYPKCTFKESL